MTSGVKQAMPQNLMPKSNADRQVLRNRANDRDFGEALGIARKGKQEAAGKHQLDAEPRWPRFGTKLDAAIDRTSGLGSKLSLTVTEPEQPDVPQASDKETLALDDAEKPAATEDADTVISLLLPAIHIPPVQARQTSDTDGEEPAPHDAQANEKNGHIAAAPTDIVATPVDDGDDERSTAPIGDDGKSSNRPGNDASPSPVMDIAKVDARPAAPRANSEAAVRQPPERADNRRNDRQSRGQSGP